ncbi:RYamide receptor [Lingula anatina]|uniref:RYamide receptor n=1 Tax=Lingula anatina TaxID=7574 RepID=A0A1S3HI01_LINAN|nr:RYamide receptor [Lingula anatina]XP_013385647.1 RYamide receptor [Lingula anatina]|eukprot:XP_013385646.1 RYamide receptor [Lingula anatina]
MEIGNTTSFWVNYSTFNHPPDTMLNTSGKVTSSISNNQGSWTESGITEIFFTFDKPATVVLFALYIPIFVVALFANVLVIYIVMRFKAMRRAKNLFIFSLALADLGVTFICMPVSLGVIVYKVWIYGAALCKLSWYMQGVCVATSILTLQAMALDRYISIRHPMSGNRLKTSKQIIQILAGIWVFSLLFLGPILYVRQVDSYAHLPVIGSLDFCAEKWPRPDGKDKMAYGILLLLIVYVIPCAVVAVCYAFIGKTLFSKELQKESDINNTTSTLIRGRKRAARTLIGLIIVFICCWLPYNITSMYLDVVSTETDELKMLPFTLWLGHAHSALNPVLYCLFNKRFGKYIKKAFTCKKEDYKAPHLANHFG